ncbi:hypothetical protein CSV61_16050 [Sporosarcina sp. P3]|uniref:hypothetical protein n=1 Tax=Sporosarcina sp. P3 TaxID=2048245 RepID=UPI000C16C7A8|nr:hypothetical protein [Sporosarcina sp. P3]PID20161.1 hypothetical protein CSV61_16050 [Sporosarcina sp. P3]
MRHKIEELHDHITDLGLFLETFQHTQSEISQMTQDADAKLYKGLQEYFLWDNHSSLKMADALLYRLAKELADIHKQMEEVTAALDVPANHSYPYEELQTMSPDRDNEIAMRYNRKAFVSEFGRDPESDEEIKTWIARVIAKIDESEQIKKA